MIKCLSKKKTYQMLLKRWNEAKTEPEVAKKEHSILEKYMEIEKADFENVTKAYEKAKSKFGDLIVEKLLSVSDGKDLGADFEIRYDNARARMLKVAQRYNRKKSKCEEAENVLKRYNEEKEKCQRAEEEAKRDLGLYLIPFTYELLTEREKIKEALELFIKECEEKFGCWYDINDAKDDFETRFCKCVFCGKSNYEIPWHKKNYVCKTYLSRDWTNVHQEAVSQINAMKECLKEIQELLEVICFAKEKHEYSEERPCFGGGSYHDCKICGHREYVDYGED